MLYKKELHNRPAKTYNFFENSKNKFIEKTYKVTTLLMLLFLTFSMIGTDVFATPVQAATSQTNPSRPVQIFDVHAGKVVKSIPNDAQFQAMAKNLLSSVTGLAPQISPDNKCSYVYRIPLTEPYSITAGGLSFKTNDIFIFHCVNTDPIILSFNEQRKPFMLLFKADLAPLLTKLKQT